MSTVKMLQELLSFFVEVLVGHLAIAGASKLDAPAEMRKDIKKLHLSLPPYLRLEQRSSPARLLLMMIPMPILVLMRTFSLHSVQFLNKRLLHFLSCFPFLKPPNLFINAYHAVFFFFAAPVNT
jgi:hypothetical protein